MGEPAGLQVSKPAQPRSAASIQSIYRMIGPVWMP
jgi:hypothetical protein